MHHLRSFTLFLLFILFAVSVQGQTAIVFGHVNDEKGSALQWVNVKVQNSTLGSVTDANGFFQLSSIPVNKKIIITISYVGYSKRDTVLLLQSGEHRIINFVLKSETTNLPGVDVKDNVLRSESVVKLNPKNVLIAPTVGSGVEDIIKTLPGVTSGNELSSQYSVRGGNYDENLVYVNGIEIYRPFLVSSGEQEGMSFINPALVSNISFSAGGFGARYGDKMSSVLDVKYKTPTSFGGSVNLSLLETGLSLGGISKNKRFTYLLGARYKTNRYLLGTLDTKGDYQPGFADFQSLFTYKLSDHLDVSLLAYVSRNKYKVIPQSRETDFGTFNQNLKFTVYFDGSEVDQYDMAQGGLTFSYHPSKDLKMNFVVSGFSTNESETYDVQGQYWIGLVQQQSTSSNEGNAVETLGVGTYLRHARNYFNAQVLSVSHRGTLMRKNQLLRWGWRYQHQWVNDRLREWLLNDSAGYSLPNPVDLPGNPTPVVSPLDLSYFASANNVLEINRFSAYVSNRWLLNTKNGDEWSVNLGTRFYYWDFAKEFLFSPRLNLAYKPKKVKDWTFRFASGIYYQPPFYRAMRDMDGQINHNIRSPKSLEFILGADYHFIMWGRPFLFTSEAYYKDMSHVIPYEVDNVRIRYYANETAKAYAVGLDMRLFGEFVNGVDSWMTLSILKTAENINDDYYYNYYDANGNLISSGSNVQAVDSVKVLPGYIPRPTDRRVNMTMFFQDYIPGNKALQVHLRLIYGTGLPFGPPQSERYQQVLRMPDYKRVDIGFSWNPLEQKVQKVSHQRLKSLWLSLEVFNLFQVKNVISYTWVKDVYNRDFAVPNYLTSRRINLKLMMNF
ncbi:MAG: TonB-dependent receptor [Bacteroidales bacterium]|nr:TonB-dependent receptor [Bacteroidales bacterium]